MRKSVSVQAEKVTTPAVSEMCARANERGAGPRTTFPVWSYCEPWQGHMYLFAALSLRWLLNLARRSRSSSFVNSCS